MPLLIRPARAGDAAGRARLWQDAGRFFASIDPQTAQEPDPRGLVDWIEEMDRKLADDPARLTLIAEIDGEVVGIVMARFSEPAPSARQQVSSDFGRRRAHVDALAVATSHRRAGVGTALMNAAERWAVERGAEVITLESNIDNPLSMPFYEHRMGYRPHEVVFRKALG